MRLSALPFLAAAIFSVPAAAATPISLDQAMAHPDWIGNPAETAWWSWDGKHVFYKQKRAGSPLRDTFEAAAGAPRLVGDAELADLDGATVVYHRARTRSILLRNGDVFERDLKSGALTQITRGANGVAAPQYSTDGASIQFRVGHDWLSWNRADRLLSPLAMARAAKDPAAPADDDAMRTTQMRLIATLQRQKDDRDAGRDRAEQERRADATRAPAPIYLGDKIVIDASALAPSGRWLLLATAPKTSEQGRIGKLPRYVTESGYEEFDDQRTRVGRNMPAPHTLKLVDLATRTVRDLSFDTLPGIGIDPLASMRARAKSTRSRATAQCASTTTAQRSCGAPTAPRPP